MPRLIGHSGAVPAPPRDPALERIRALPELPIRDLRRAWSEAGPSDALPNAVTLKWRVEELLTLPTIALQEAWSTAWGVPPPKGARRRFLMLGIAWRWQAAVLGGPSRSLERRLAALEAACRSGPKIEPGRSTARPLLPGTRLVRDWRGERHEVHVVEDGFIWRGKTRRSLSAIASEIAGGRRNGPAFFGLRDGIAVR
jgi:hypothetical protein